MANDLGITHEDVDESYEETLDPNTTTWVQQKVDEAVRELLAYIPDLSDRIASGKVDAQLVTDKVVGAVLRVVRNPKGIETEDEGDYGIKLRNTVASGDVWFQEKDLLQLGWQGKQKKTTPRTVRVTATSGWGFP